jgi:hypothetical protein
MSGGSVVGSPLAKAVSSFFANSSAGGSPRTATCQICRSRNRYAERPASGVVNKEFLGLEISPSCRTLIWKASSLIIGDWLLFPIIGDKNAPFSAGKGEDFGVKEAWGIISRNSCDIVTELSEVG